MIGRLLSVGLSAALAVTAHAQNPIPKSGDPLPADVNSVTLSRLPPATPELLSAEAAAELAARENYRPSHGPPHVTVYSPRSIGLGIPTGETSPIGARYFQLAVLIAAREIDQQYEWSAHEPMGLRQGLEQHVIDIVKYDRPVAGLNDEDTTFINFCRTLLRDHGVSSELWADMVGHFGYQQTVQTMMIMGDYLRAGIMLNAVNQQMPEGREGLLPPLDR